MSFDLQLVSRVLMCPGLPGTVPRCTCLSDGIINRWPLSRSTVSWFEQLVIWWNQLQTVTNKFQRRKEMGLGSGVWGSH